MKVTKAYFNCFKRAFVQWQQALGLTEYSVYFELVELDELFAQITINEIGKVTNVQLNSLMPSDIARHDPGPEAHARHEAFHLLLHRLAWLGDERYVSASDLVESEEAIIRRLENLFGHLPPFYKRKKRCQKQSR